MTRSPTTSSLGPDGMAREPEPRPGVLLAALGLAQFVLVLPTTTIDVAVATPGDELRTFLVPAR